MTLFASAAEWRKTIPWTDAEIIACLRSLATETKSESTRNYLLHWAAWVEETGRLHKGILRHVVPVLVKKCFCGKTALYRYGCVGRCREHMNMRPAFIHERQARQDQKSEDFNAFHRRLAARDREAHPGCGGGRSIAATSFGRGQ